MTLFLVSGAIGAGYGAARSPLPGQVLNNASSVFYYSDGRTEIARLGAENRTEVSLAQVPEHVQQAILAAENRDFSHDSGISAGGILRAMWADVRGKPVQGGSTITQQYVKNAYLGPERTFARKRSEIILSVKLDREYSKRQILEWYLNTIYFGRGAYGIEAAAETYFDRSVGRLTVEQAAVLASGIRAPAAYDPQEHPRAAHDRWHYVLRGMVGQGWLAKSRAGQAKYPAVRPIGASDFNDLSGPKGYIVWQVVKELAAHGISEDMVRRGGLRIVTTIDRRAQESAVAAMARVFVGQPADLQQALVAVEPGTGRVRAYYGGKDGYGAWDHAVRALRPAPRSRPTSSPRH